MSQNAKFDAYKKKLDGVCEENNLVYRFTRDKYPIALTIRPLTGMDDQLSMLENVEEDGFTSPDASIVFTLKDGALAYKMDKRFTINDALFSKIKNLFKNLCHAYLEFFFRDILSKGILTAKTMPAIDDTGSDDGQHPAGSTPFEEFADGEDGEGGDDADGDDAEQAEVAKIIEDDPQLVAAIRIVRAENFATVTLLQRRMSIGYSNAARLIDAMEEFGVVGPYDGSNPREILPYDEPDDEGLGELGESEEGDPDAEA